MVINVLCDVRDNIKQNYSKKSLPLKLCVLEETRHFVFIMHLSSIESSIKNHNQHYEIYYYYVIAANINPLPHKVHKTWSL